MTVLIATYNRSRHVRPTLESIAGLRTPPGVTWDVLIVDNNSTDDTRQVVESMRPTYPVPLRYLFERRQGKSNALNAGITITGASVIMFTDDDVRVPAQWLEVALERLTRPDGPDYVGGPVRPWWEAPPPRWLDFNGRLSATLALLDYGAEEFVFEDRRTIPLGVNMAVRRSLIARTGGFHPDLGRIRHSLMGQEQAEFFQRSRAAGGRGVYVPDMWLQHFVPARRLTLRYFGRWWYFKGVSHRRWHAMHRRTETGLDLRQARHVLGIPRFVIRAGIRDLVKLCAALVRADHVSAARYAFGLCYRIGYVREAWFGARVHSPVRDTGS